MPVIKIREIYLFEYEIPFKTMCESNIDDIQFYFKNTENIFRIENYMTFASQLFRQFDYKIE